jgi:hypothetical protein
MWSPIARFSVKVKAIEELAVQYPFSSSRQPHFRLDDNAQWTPNADNVAVARGSNESGRLAIVPMLTIL